MCNPPQHPVPPRAKILLVEDDTGVRRSLQLLLQGKGYSVGSYACAATLLEDGNADDAACLVSDYRMPGLDGVRLLEQLRGRGWTGPAILITAYSSPDVDRAAVTCGYSSVLAKPMADRLLTEAVSRLLREAGPPAP